MPGGIVGVRSIFFNDELRDVGNDTEEVSALGFNHSSQSCVILLTAVLKRSARHKNNLELS